MTPRGDVTHAEWFITQMFSRTVRVTVLPGNSFSSTVALIFLSLRFYGMVHRVFFFQRWPLWRWQTSSRSTWCLRLCFKCLGDRIERDYILRRLFFYIYCTFEQKFIHQQGQWDDPEQATETCTACQSHVLNSTVCSRSGAFTDTRAPAKIGD